MRLKEFQSYLAEQKINLAFFPSTDSTLTYFTQTQLSQGHLTITRNDSLLYLTRLDKKPKMSTADIKEWKKDTKIKKVGINKENLTLKTHEKLKKIYPKAEFVDVSEKIHQLREQKTQKEINLIKKACNITDIAFQELIHHLPKLKTEADVAFLIDKTIREHGAELAFPTIVAMGKNAAIPHHVTSTQKLSRGFLLLDFGARYKNYCSDMSRVLFLGRPNIEEKKFYELLRNTQSKTIENISDNKSFCELNEIARKNLGKYSSYFIHSLGHGVGIDIHEPICKQVKNGQIFTIEPGIYFPRKFGLRIEDTILFDKKAQILTKSPKVMIKLPQTF